VCCGPVIFTLDGTIRMQGITSVMFKFGSLVAAICFVLLVVASFVLLVLQRQLSVGETFVVLAGAAMLGTSWWLVLLRRLRAKGKDV
jgi:uncharacterized membrane protein